MKPEHARLIAGALSERLSRIKVLALSEREAHARDKIAGLVDELLGALEQVSEGRLGPCAAHTHCLHRFTADGVPIDGPDIHARQAGPTLWLTLCYCCRPGCHDVWEVPLDVRLEESKCRTPCQVFKQGALGGPAIRPFEGLARGLYEWGQVIDRIRPPRVVSVPGMDGHVALVNTSPNAQVQVAQVGDGLVTIRVTDPSNDPEAVHLTDEQRRVLVLTEPRDG